MRPTVRRLAIWFGAVSTGAMLLGCAKGKGDAGAAASASASARDDVEAFLADDSAPLTATVYEKLVLRLAQCKMLERGIDPACPANRDLTRARGHRTPPRELSNINSQVGLKLIGHESAPVRLQAARLLQAVMSSNPQAIQTLVEAARKEKEPAVLAAIVRAVGSRQRDREDVKQLLLQLADHASPLVRQEALNWFVSPAGATLPGAFDKVLERVENDPAEEVRARLCQRLYATGDERAIAIFEKYLTAKDTPAKIYSSCFTGLINSWAGFPRPTNPSKQGYELTLKLLEQKPRTKEQPPWSALSGLRSAKTEFLPNDKAGNEWLERVKPWYKKDRLLRALKSLATDPDAHWMARRSALQTMRELGESRKTFEELAKKYEKATTGDDAQIKRELESLLRRPESEPGRPGVSGSALGAPPVPPPHPGPDMAAPPGPRPPPGSPATPNPPAQPPAQP